MLRPDFDRWRSSAAEIRERHALPPSKSKRLISVSKSKSVTLKEGHICEMMTDGD